MKGQQAKKHNKDTKYRINEEKRAIWKGWTKEAQDKETKKDRKGEMKEWFKERTKTRLKMDRSKETRKIEGHRTK